MMHMPLSVPMLMILPPPLSLSLFLMFPVSLPLPLLPLPSLQCLFQRHAQDRPLGTSMI